MQRCTRDPDLVRKCGLDSLFTRPFRATIDSPDSISVVYVSEWYDHRAADARGCEWVRNASGDHDVTVSLTRQSSDVTTTTSPTGTVSGGSTDTTVTVPAPSANGFSIAGTVIRRRNTRGRAGAATSRTIVNVTASVELVTTGPGRLVGRLDATGEAHGEITRAAANPCPSQPWATGTKQWVAQLDGTYRVSGSRTIVSAQASPATFAAVRGSTGAAAACPGLAPIDLGVAAVTATLVSGRYDKRTNVRIRGETGTNYVEIHLRRVAA
jgi:hypothetical protein